MQNLEFLTLIGISLIIIGIFLVLASMFVSSKSTESTEVKTESKSRGVILLGPIPIVWGFGDNTKRIMLILFVIAIVVSLFIFL